MRCTIFAWRGAGHLCVRLIGSENDDEFAVLVRSGILVAAKWTRHRAGRPDLKIRMRAQLNLASRVEEDGEQIVDPIVS